MGQNARKPKIAEGDTVSGASQRKADDGDGKERRRRVFARDTVAGTLASERTRGRVGGGGERKEG